MNTRKSFLAISAVSAVCLAFYGCDGSAPSGADGTESAFGGSSSSGGSGFGSGKISSSGKTSNSGSKSGSVISCYVELGNDGSAACSEVPTSYLALDQFKETCNAQNMPGLSSTTLGSGCPSGGKKCDQGGGIMAYYYGAAAEVNSCLDEYSSDDYSSYNGSYDDDDYGSYVDNYGSSGVLSGSDAKITGSVYSCMASSSGHSYCGEISQSSSDDDVADFKFSCSEEGGALGTGCPTTTKKCLFYDLLIYFYDSADIAKSCEELYEEEW